MSKAFIQDGINGGRNLQPLPTFRYGHYATPTCINCGCTEKIPCFDGDVACFWVTLNKNTNAGLCSECIGF